MKISKTSYLLFIFMLLAAFLSHYLKPTQKLADKGPKVNLESTIPTAFNGWEVEKSIVPLLADPSTTAMLNKIYNQTLNRTYIKNGRVMMVSIAYGGDQSDAMQVHKPEICYKAQGFVIQNTALSNIKTGAGNIPITRVLAMQGERIEPITYWYTVGDEIAKNRFDFKLQQLRYGLTGKIPDGLLFRVSTIEPNEQKAYEMEDQFVNDLIASLSADSRVRLIGKLK